jgi:hypothetical protein
MAIKYIFAFITLIHGLIHFMGFAKAFNYGNITQLTKDITKPIGVLWCVTGLLFLICLALYLLKKESWVYFAVIAVVLSQFLIINNWQDAKFGTIANVLILVVTVIGFFQIKFKNEYRKEVNIGLAESQNMPNTILTEAEIAYLPEPVRKYIRYAGCINKPIVNNFKIEFSGKIRSHEKKDWMQLTSEQYNFIKTPTRLFFLDATMKGLPVGGFHSFKNGNAFMDIRLLSMFKVQYMTGKEAGISETVTFFNDMCVMAPAALIDTRIAWLEIEGNKVKASFSNNGITISAWLFFNEKGELVNFVSEDRSALEEDGTITKLKWSTPLRDYKDINGYRLASYAETIYTYPDGDFTYATFTLKNIEYNNKTL